MNETIRIITAMILIMGAAVTILSIQTVSAGPINTSRSNIKALRTDASGDDSQATSQDIDTEIITSADNTCSESECSNSIILILVTIQTMAQKQRPDS